MRLLVSIHDVAPPFLGEVQELWALCQSLDICPGLLVVPNWHGAHPVEEHRATVNWVQTGVQRGASVLLHGDRHDEVGLRRSASDHLVAAGRTAREGEFLTLDAAGAYQRIAVGVATLRALRLDPVGFVPPAWLARREHRRAVRQAGLALTEDAGAIWLVRRDVRVTSPTIRWSARTAWRARVSAWVAAARATRRASLLRVALHPTDLHARVTAASVRRILPLLAEAATPLTYSALACEDDLGCAA